MTVMATLVALTPAYLFIVCWNKYLYRFTDMGPFTSKFAGISVIVCITMLFTVFKSILRLPVKN